MLIIELRFLARRYHATPWNHNVNEGVVEWPPSPWRLLRALVATWFNKGGDVATTDRIKALLVALSGELPVYGLPRGTLSHTRHYMPLYEGSKKPKVFDAFVHVDDRWPLSVRWPSVSLSDDASGLLDVLLGRMGYLGRAESWADARVVSNDDVNDESPYATRPLGESDDPAEDEEIVPVLSPLAPTAFDSWRTRVIETMLERRLAEKRSKAEAKQKDPDKENIMPADIKRIESAVPEDLLAALQCDTTTLRKAGWSGVPGARWVDYVRPRSALEVKPVRPPRPTRRQLATAARFAVASQVPPRLTEAVSVAERVRTALMSRSEAAPVFSGRDEAGNARTGHDHAFILPEANGAHGRITHVTLYAAMGFDDRARRAMDGLHEVWGRDGHNLQLVLIGVGAPGDFAGTEVVRGQCPLFVQSAVWISRTPFVPTRHPKKKITAEGLQVGSPEHDLRRLIEAQGLPEPLRVEPIMATDLGGKRTRWLTFGTVRKSGEGRRANISGGGFRVTFPTPVGGPIALGYGAHYGLGLFVPDVESPRSYDPGGR